MHLMAISPNGYAANVRGRTELRCTASILPAKWLAPCLSAEFQGVIAPVARYGALGNSQFVTLVYNNVLGRAPDSGGLSFWTGQLNSGAMSRGAVMPAFSESAEYRGLIANEVYVTMMYTGMLRRSPDPGGFNFWVSYLDSGNSGLALTGGFITSAEYRSRFLP
jgi:hypothetical protein